MAKSLQDKTDINKLQRAVVDWAERQFPAQPVVSKIKHLRREVEELLKKPADRGEMADCLLLLLHIAQKAQVDGHTLLACAFDKLEINKARTWGPPDADGICEHVRAEEPEA